jgi:hypothetical protein
LFIGAEAWQMVGAIHHQLPEANPDERPQECPHHAVRSSRDGAARGRGGVERCAFEVSTRTVRKWLARFCSDGDAGLQNRSSAPRSGQVVRAQPNEPDLAAWIKCLCESAPGPPEPRH